MYICSMYVGSTQQKQKKSVQTTVNKALSQKCFANKHNIHTHTYVCVYVWRKNLFLATATVKYACVCRCVQINRISHIFKSNAKAVNSKQRKQKSEDKSHLNAGSVFYQGIIYGMNMAELITQCGKVKIRYNSKRPEQAQSCPHSSGRFKS